MCTKNMEDVGGSVNEKETEAEQEETLHTDTSTPEARTDMERTIATDPAAQKKKSVTGLPPREKLD